LIFPDRTKRCKFSLPEHALAIAPYPALFWWEMEKVPENAGKGSGACNFFCVSGLGNGFC
jgi:hypothetical protein